MKSLYKYNGTFYSYLSDRVILSPYHPKNPTPVNIIGQNFIHYGKAQNENYLYLTENFSSPNAPVNVKGQKWFKIDDYNGEFFISPYDKCNLKDWITIPAISKVSSTPPKNQSSPGRMIIQNNDTLKIFMNNQWSVIPAKSSKESYNEIILNIRYDMDGNSPVNVKNPNYSTDNLPILQNAIQHKAGTWTNIARYNDGGSYDSELDKPNGLVVSGDGSLVYGGTYFWNASIVARDALNLDLYKTWEISSSFFVPSMGDQIERITVDPLKYCRPDPRIIAPALGYDSSPLYIKVIHSTELTDAWDIRVHNDLNFLNLSDITDPSSSIIDVQRYILNGDLYGMMFQGITDSDSNLQWDIEFTIQGTPNKKAQQSLNYML